ncbi:MAG TPA: DUF3267 domain-containing protein [Clostridiaceae bacterium]|jgi:hypothetical protein|nr:DUF3267 domain-containing protein [Clostridiaceae bacterium]
MPKIKWIGLIKEEKMKDYQVGELSKNAKKMNMPTTSKEMMIKALPFIIPALVILFLSVYFKSGEFFLLRLYIIIGVLLGFLALIIHELLHAIVYPKNANVYIGIAKPITFVALASYPLKKEKFILMCLLPYILGIIPLILFWIMPITDMKIHSILFGLSAMGLGSPYPDLFNVYQVLKQTPKNCKIQFYKDDTYYIE